MKPEIIPVKTALDDRGSLMFADNFNFDDIKRFYIVKNHQPNFIRAWHAHKNESKYCFVLSGTFLIGAVEIDNWENPSKNTEINKFTISADVPSILHIPPGYANGFKNLTPDAKVIIFSTSTIEEAKIDDFRYPYDYWNIWKEDYR